MKIETAVVPIAGWGTRLLPISLLVAKEFLPLGQKPVIQHIAEELGAAGIRKIVLVASDRKKTAAKFFEKDSRIEALLTGSKAFIGNRLWSKSPYADVAFTTVIQDKQLGLGHAIQCARSAVGDQPFVVALGDCLVGLPGNSSVLPRMLKHAENPCNQILISLVPVPDDRVGRYGIAKPRGADFETADVIEIEDLIEKPTVGTAPSNLAICGRYLFPPEIFDELDKTQPGQGGEIQLTDAISRMIRNGTKAIGVLLAAHEKRYDVGTMQSYVQSFVEFALADPELRSSVQAAGNADFLALKH